MQQKISVIIITKNEARNIRECLRSVAWADEIVVVDAESTDATRDICSEFTTRVVVRPWSGFADQKRFALEQASQLWVLSVDADERVPETLTDEIKKAVHSNEFDGFKIPRLSTFLGKPIYHGGWYPGYQLRLFRRERCRLSQPRVHEGFIVDGKVGLLKNHLLHYTHATVQESFDRMNRYSSLEALDRLERQPGKRVRWWDLLAHPCGEFFRKAVAKQGWRDGMHGLIMALVSAAVKLALYAKWWERQKENKS
jgi:glycosyltransferase involved in cell wall biosynthesis